MSKKTDTNIPTPRTDALEKESSSDGFHAYAADGWKLARQLERELAQAKADLAAGQISEAVAARIKGRSTENRDERIAALEREKIEQQEDIVQYTKQLLGILT